MLSEQGPVAVVEFHSRNSFVQWDSVRGSDVLRLGTPIGTVLRAFGADGFWRRPEPSPHSLISGKAEWGSLSPLPTRAQLRRWESESNGAGRPLSWRKYPANKSRQGVNKIIGVYEAVNSEADRTAAEAHYQATERDALEKQASDARAAMEAASIEFHREMEELFGTDYFK